MLSGDIAQKISANYGGGSSRLCTAGIIVMSIHYEMEKRATLIDTREILIFQK